MKSIQRLTLMLGFIAGLCFPAVTHAQPPEPERLRLLMSFAAEGLGVYADNVPLPRIIYVSNYALQVEGLGVQAVSRMTSDSPNPFDHHVALFNFKEGVMMLRNDVDYTDPKHEWVLVHELVHYIQLVFRHLFLDKVPCTQKLEPAAYRTANLWVIASGHGQLVNGMMKIGLSRCPATN